MKIQPTQMSASSYLNFGSKHVNTKLPKGLQVKPHHKAPKGLLISLVPLSVLGFGVFYWQANKDEAMEHFRKSRYGQSIFKQNLERVMRMLEAALPAETPSVVNTTPKISMWKALSNAPIQSENTISMQDALEKYGVQTKSISIQDETTNSISMQGAFLKYVNLPQNTTEMPAKD